METVIRTPAQLRALRSRKARGNLGKVVLEMGGDPAEVRRAEAEINKNLRACGCEMGALFLSCGLAAVAVSFLLWPDWYELTALRTLLEVCGFLGALTVAGKIVGLLAAERKLRAAIDSFAHSSMTPE
jgi:hypothetical protein